MLVQRGGYYTIADYVHGVVDDSGEEFSALAVRVKAAALYDHAQYVGSQFRADLAPPARAELLARAGALDALIQRAHGALIGVRNRSADDMREVLLARTFLCAASVQLQAGLVSTQLPAWQRSVCAAVAAGGALDLVDVSQFPFLDPVIAVSVARCRGRWQGWDSGSCG